MKEFLEHWEAIRVRLLQHHHHPTLHSLEELMTIQTTALVAASTALKTTCDAIVAQGKETAAAATAAAEAAVAKAEEAAQADIDSSTTKLTDAESELSALLEPVQGTSDNSTGTAQDATTGTAQAPSIDANGNHSDAPAPSA